MRAQRCCLGLGISRFLRRCSPFWQFAGFQSLASARFTLVAFFQSCGLLTKSLERMRAGRMGCQFGCAWPPASLSFGVSGMSGAASQDASRLQEAKGSSRWSVVMMLLVGVLFLGYVLSAPLLHDRHGFPLPMNRPVWSAAHSGPFSAILRPYFKLCGIEFQTSPPQPPRESYE
jgi:hypothetical protein